MFLGLVCIELERITIERVKGDQVKDLMKVLRALPQRPIVGEESLTLELECNKLIWIKATCPSVTEYHKRGNGNSLPCAFQSYQETNIDTNHYIDWDTVKFNSPKGSRNREGHSNKISFRDNGFKCDLYKTQ